MAKKSSAKKTQTRGLAPYWSDWTDLDKTFDNFRRDLERSFSSFPSVKFPSMQMPAMPKMTPSTCDVIDEGDKLRVKMDVPGVKKNEIDLNVTDNSIEISAKHKEQAEDQRQSAIQRYWNDYSFFHNQYSSIGKFGPVSGFVTQ